MNAITRIRAMAKVLAIALSITAAMAIGSTHAANAAGPNYLEPGQKATYPTYWWGYTKVCAYNYGSQSGRVAIRGWTGYYWRPIYPYFWDPYPRTTTCVYGRFKGAYITLFNEGMTALSTYTE